MNQPRVNDSKTATTAIIWAFATGMLAICIPLVALTGSGVILPLAVLLGASGGTAVVWRSDRNRNTFKLTNDISQLQQRIVDLETICSSDEINLQKKLEKWNQEIHSLADNVTARAQSLNRNSKNLALGDTQERQEARLCHAFWNVSSFSLCKIIT